MKLERIKLESTTEDGKLLMKLEKSLELESPNFSETFQRQRNPDNFARFVLT